MTASQFPPYPINLRGGIHFVDVRNGKRVSAALSGVLKESADQQRRIKAIIGTAATLLEEIKTCEQILMNPDRHKAMEVMKKKLNERAHLLHPSVSLDAEY